MHQSIVVPRAAVLVFVLGCLGPPAAAVEETLAGAGAAMRYLANASDPGIGLDWTQAAFDDSTWSVGTYGVGYEVTTGAENLIQTAVPNGTYSVYTRFVFDVEDVSEVNTLGLGADYDDAFAAWLNGVEIYRSPEVPAGALDWNTGTALHESSNGGQPDYDPIQDLSVIALPLLQNGTNVLAIGVWNAAIPSSDLVLVPRVVLNEAVSLVRGPYLQLGTSFGITVRWRTDTPETSRVVFGIDPALLDSTASDNQLTTEHTVTLSGLQPDTRYYYAIGDDAGLHVGGVDHTFATAPPTGATQPMRIWAIGDTGTGAAGAFQVRNGYLTFAGQSHTDLWLMLGDIAYQDGTDQNFQDGLFDVYPGILRQTVLWPTYGNHDAISADASSQSGPYYDVFTLPGQAQAGGLASGTEAYYSFDYGNVHFVVLDSSESDRLAGGAQMTWLAQDLASTMQDWLIAYWHHPPYSAGSHNSDVEVELIEMRENALPILEAHGADLVLTGHSHGYERSMLIDGHYGDSTTFGSGFVLDGGDGSEQGSGAYQKTEVGLSPHQGTVYAVAGNGAILFAAPLDHPAMVVSLSLLGSMVIDIDGDRMDARMIGTAGETLDNFTIVKGPYCTTLDDADGDGICDGDDNCPLTPSTDQADDDADGLGNPCDPCPNDPGNDPDADGVCAAGDNCPLISNPAQADADSDGTGDACDACPMDPADDADLDGFCADADNCPALFNPCQRDADADGLGDYCDASSPAHCNVFVDADSYLEQDRPSRRNANRNRLESDGTPGVIARPVIRFDLASIPDGSQVIEATGWLHLRETDPGSIDVHRITDNWQGQDATWNSLSSDFDPPIETTFVPESDDDLVGYDLTSLTGRWIDGTELNQGIMLISTGAGSRFDSDESSSDRPCLHVLFECLTPETDSDGDGTPDIDDGCPNDPAKIDPGFCGCGEVDLDSDADGTYDCDDLCPQDPTKIDPGVCGCGVVDTDSDGDGTADCVDPCPFDPDDDLDLDTVCGDVDNCPAIANVAQGDLDTDAQGDLCDACPLDPGSDPDADAICSNNDNCVTVANAAQTDSDGDEQGDACDACPFDLDDDLDQDGVCGDQDNCPGTPNPNQFDADMNGIGDACESPFDVDGDSVDDGSDNCPFDSNAGQQDLDDDGKGDACDLDDDGDGAEDILDCDPDSPAVTSAPGLIGETLLLTRTPAGTRLDWTRASQGHVSHVYRGIVAPGVVWSTALDCVDVATPFAESVQLDVPAVGYLFYYLVGAANTCGDGSLGPGEAGTPRSASPGCVPLIRDTDLDGVSDIEDNCPLVFDPDLADLDGDFIGDVCDPCPADPGNGC